ncbi:unnamed protein product [Staurois parvus]|uniref:Uncharacterized protein n=1 Tax=Staurois parvus TaxID=386267 RepID=A0ABN9APM3_9NEOB|nr:unnamed protein product [Staurois parvus]
MAGNSVSAYMEQCVVMKFLVNEGVKPKETEDFKHSTVMRCSAAKRNSNGVNISKMSIRPSGMIPAVVVPSPQQSFL